MQSTMTSAPKVAACAPPARAGLRYSRLFGGAVECLNDQPDADYDRRNRRQYAGRDAGERDNSEDDNGDSCGAFGQQTDRLHIANSPSTFRVEGHFLLLCVEI